jgi:hypothetical protein
MENRNSIRVRPSLRRILDMDNETLLANYALIAHKASSLSSTQRMFLQRLLQMRLNKGFIKDEEVAQAVTDLANMIKEQVDAKLKEDDSRSSK